MFAWRTSLVILSILLLYPQLSAAGVIVETEYSGSDGYKLIELIQGHREKSAAVFSKPEPKDPLTLVKGTTVWDIIDLDKGTDTEIDYAKKSYHVTPYPTENPWPPEPEVFRPTGKHRKVFGYWCDEFIASVDSAKFGKRTDIECVSSQPPGAKEYIEFEKLGTSKSVKAGTVSHGYEPDGFVLDSRTEDYDGDNEGPRITLIKSMRISPSEFEPPAGFAMDKDPQPEVP
jgi:hypothetical protein